MTKQQHQIIEILRQNQPSMKKYGVRRLGLFGSFAHGNEKPSSDLDFVVEFEKKHSTAIWV